MLKFKKYWKPILLFVVSCIVIYCVIYASFYTDGFIYVGNDLEKKDWLSFLGTYLTFIGAVAVACIALFQNVEFSRRENERRAQERFDRIQPIFSIEIQRNVKISGVVEPVSMRTGGSPCHNNIEMCIENVSEYPIMHMIIFDKYIKPGDKTYITCAYYDSIDVQKHPKLVTVVSEDYERIDGNIPSWFNICYEDVDGHSMFQTFKINKFENKYYYSLSSREYVEDVSIKTKGL